MKMQIKKLLSEYLNGNYVVRIFTDGTKIRKTNDDEFYPIYPESIDLKITSYCDRNCPNCHESSSIEGIHANLDLPFFNTLKPGMEIAIGGGNPLSHPSLNSFLQRMKTQKVICNITINQKHLFQNTTYVQSLIDNKLIYGIGISYEEATDELFLFCSKNHNAIIHLILGIHSLDTLNKLSNKHLKILFLGYKRFGRGETYYSQDVLAKTNEVFSEFDNYKNNFSVIALDNKAYKDLEIYNRITSEEYAKYYMGNDGNFTMYIDAVSKQYALNSTTPIDNRYSLENDIIKMFQTIKKEKK